MTRVLSALVLIPAVVGIIWFLPPVATLVLAEVVALLAFIEYADLARALRAQVPRVISGAAVLAACYAVSADVPLDVIVLSALIVIGAAAVGARQPGPAVLGDVAIS